MLPPGPPRAQAQASKKQMFSVSPWPLTLPAPCPLVPLHPLLLPQYASSYGMVTLYGLMPPLMAWRLRARQEAEGRSPARGVARSGRGGGLAGAATWAASLAQPGSGGAFVPGGTPVLAGMLAVAAVIGWGRLAADLGLPPPLEAVAGGLTQVAGGAGPLTRQAAAVIDATLL